MPLLSLMLRALRKQSLRVTAMKKGAEVLSVVYESFNPLAKSYPQSVYGYDYNENFLIFLSKVDLEAVNKYIAELTKIINEKLNASKKRSKVCE